MNDAMTIALVNRVPELQRLWQAIEDFCSAHDLPAEVCFELRVATEEIFTNIVKYGYMDAAEHPIVVDLALHGDDLILRFQDDATAFNPLAIDPVRAAAERTVGGRGVRLWRGLMDEMEYRREENKNILVIKKNLALWKSASTGRKKSRR